MKAAHKEQPDLFPDELREAEQCRELERIFNRMGREAQRDEARARLESDTTGMQNLIVKNLREHGPNDLLLLFDSMEDICEGAAKEEIERAQVMVFGIAVRMVRAGILWMHKWSEGIATFGIRGLHSKAEMLRRAKIIEEEQAIIGGYDHAKAFRKKR